MPILMHMSDSVESSRHSSNCFTMAITPDSVITCASTRLMYMTRCLCGLDYNGKTPRKFKQRINEHKSINYLNYPIAIHFNNAHHDISSLQFCGIEQVTLPPRGSDHDKLLKPRRRDLRPSNVGSQGTL